jgi:hypothetical protein
VSQRSSDTHGAAPGHANVPDRYGRTTPFGNKTTVTMGSKRLVIDWDALPRIWVVIVAVSGAYLAYAQPEWLTSLWSSAPKQQVAAVAPPAPAPAPPAAAPPAPAPSTPVHTDPPEQARTEPTAPQAPVDKSPQAPPDHQVGQQQPAQAPPETSGGWFPSLGFKSLPMGSNGYRMSGGMGCTHWNPSKDCDGHSASYAGDLTSKPTVHGSDPPQTTAATPVEPEKHIDRLAELGEKLCRAAGGIPKNGKCLNKTDQEAEEHHQRIEVLPLPAQRARITCRDGAELARDGRSCVRWEEVYCPRNGETWKRPVRESAIRVWEDEPQPQPQRQEQEDEPPHYTEVSREQRGCGPYGFGHRDSWGLCAFQPWEQQRIRQIRVREREQRWH